MNGEIEVAKTAVVVFPLKPHDEVSEVKSVKIEEVRVSEMRISEPEARFARLKKTLRKRSRSIL